MYLRVTHTTYIFLTAGLVWPVLKETKVVIFFISVLFQISQSVMSVTSVMSVMLVTLVMSVTSFTSFTSIMSFTSVMSVTSVTSVTSFSSFTSVTSVTLSCCLRQLCQPRWPRHPRQFVPVCWLSQLCQTDRIVRQFRTEHFSVLFTLNPNQAIFIAHIF